MQQTEKYKLNLIESSDPFLPDALNQNTQKVEEVLSENLGAMQGTLAALGKNLGTTGHNCRVLYGVRTGDNTSGPEHPTVLNVDFYPVLICTGYERYSAMVAIRGVTLMGYYDRDSNVVVTWGDRSVTLCHNDPRLQLNSASHPQPYLILGYDLDE